MKKIKLGLCYLLLILGTTLFAQQQQVIADLYFDATNHRTKLLYDNGATHIINGDVYKETVGGNTQGVIWLNRLKAGQDGYAEFVIDKFDVGIDVEFYLVDEQNPSATNFVLKLNSGTVALFDETINSYVSDGSYMNGDVFKIERCVDKIFYYKNGVKYAVESSVSPGIALAAKAEILGAELNSSNEPPRLTINFPKELPSNNFVQLKKKLDGTFFKSNRVKLKFTYVEKYAQEAGDVISCKIYDWEGTPQGAAASYPTVYGVNWLVMPLPTSLNPDEFYTLEVNNPNKGETYFLRFKY